MVSRKVKRRGRINKVSINYSTGHVETEKGKLAEATIVFLGNWSGIRKRRECQ